jgi:hypothetical protein
MRCMMAGFIAVTLAATAQVRAQEGSTVGAFEIRPVVGMYIPTGSMRNDFRDAILVGFQGGFEFSPNIHVLLGGFWSRNDTHFSTLPSRIADIWQFDAGAEFNLLRPMGRDWFFRPFLGGGAGLRTYDYLQSGSNTCLAGYAAAGAEAQRFAGAVRVEARDYLTCYESPFSSSKNTRNDVGISLGFVYHVM